MFMSVKAMEQHRRIAHRGRSLLRWYLPEDAVCPSCKRQYSSRLRLAAHVNDKRRGAECKDFILSGKVPKLSSKEVQALDEMETEMRVDARRQGHSQPLVLGSHR